MRDGKEYPLARYDFYTDTPYDPARCAAEDWPSYDQCRHPAGLGDRGLFCKRHARLYPEPEVVK